jgi:ribosomal protein L21
VFKMKRRKQYRKTRGHRTQQTQIRVTSINV